MKFRSFAVALAVASAFSLGASDNYPEAKAQEAKELSQKCESGDIRSCFVFLSFIDTVAAMTPEGKLRFENAGGYARTPEALAQIAKDLSQKCDSGIMPACIMALTIADKVAHMSAEDQKRFEDAGGFDRPSKGKNNAGQASDSLKKN